MILKRGVKFQLVAFALLTIVGVSVVLVNYLNVGAGVLKRQYVTYVDLSDAGGVFTNAEVTYRGVAVGRVGPIQLTEDGIKVKLILDRRKRIPRDATSAIVANRSAVGEQYVDLQPNKNTGPYLDEGKPFTIPRKMTKLPVSTAELLQNVDKLVSSIDPKDLGTIVDELDKAFAGSGTDLQKILDDTDRLLKTADTAYPDTKQLLDNSKIVLDAQRSQGANIQGFARNLNELTTQIRKDDPALRATIDATPGAVDQAGKAIDDLSPTLPVLLANLTTTGQVITSRQAGLRSLFILYPVAVAGNFTVMPGDGTQHMGLALNIDSPPPCTRGYEKVQRRWPQDTKRKTPRLDVSCKLPKNSPTDVRGSRNVPQSAQSPTPKLPPGATDGAGFPEGGAKGTTSGNNNADQQRAAVGANGQATDSNAVQNPSQVFIPFPSNAVELAGYDPATGAVYGPDGKRYALPTTAGSRQLGEEASWKWLLLGPLAQ